MSATVAGLTRLRPTRSYTTLRDVTGESVDGIPLRQQGIQVKSATR